MHRPFGTLITSLIIENIYFKLGKGCSPSRLTKQGQTTIKLHFT